MTRRWSITSSSWSKPRPPKSKPPTPLPRRRRRRSLQAPLPANSRLESSLSFPRTRESRRRRRFSGIDDFISAALDSRVRGNDRGNSWRGSGGLLGVRAFDRIKDDLPCFGGIAPAFDLHPFAGFQVLVMGKEMLDLLRHDLGQILRVLHIAIIGKGRVDRHAQKLFVTALFVRHLEHADRPRLYHRAWDKGRARDHERIQRVAILAQ